MDAEGQENNSARKLREVAEVPQKRHESCMIRETQSVQFGFRARLMFRMQPSSWESLRSNRISRRLRAQDLWLRRFRLWGSSLKSAAYVPDSQATGQ